MSTKTTGVPYTAHKTNILILDEIRSTWAAGISSTSSKEADNEAGWTHKSIIGVCKYDNARFGGWRTWKGEIKNSLVRQYQEMDREKCDRTPQSIKGSSTVEGNNSSSLSSDAPTSSQPDKGSVIGINCFCS